jgi:hypothetical protein
MVRACGLSTLLATALLSGAAVADPEDPAPPDERQIRELVERLGSPSFLERESAERQLQEVGPAAIPALRAIADADSLELRYRVERLIESLEQLAVERALEAIVRGEAQADFSELTGWRRFQAEVGDSAAAREMFAAMVRTEPLLMRLSDGPGEELQRALELRCTDLNLETLQRSKEPTSPATVAAVIFGGTHPECRPGAAVSGCIQDLVQRGEVRNLMVGPAASAGWRKLIGAWVTRTDASNAYQRLDLAAQFELPEGIDAARELIRARGHASQVQTAIFFIARLGGPEHVHDLEQLLDDKTQLGSHTQAGNVTSTSQVRDAALAGLLHMTQQDLAEYGFEPVRRSSRQLFVPGTVGFRDEERRREAFAKWDRWRDANLKDVWPAEEFAVEGATA